MTSTGQSQETTELAERWLQWVAATSVFSSPLLDETGAAAGRRQPRDVWFLAGTMGGSARREFAVPARLPLFGPAFCMWGPEPITVTDVATASGEVRVDGLDVATEWVATGPVRVHGQLLNPVTRFPWPVSVYLVGVWTRIEPLAVGTHSLEIRGEDGHEFAVNVDAAIRTLQL